MAEERGEASFGVCRDDTGRVGEVEESQGIPEEPTLSEPEATVDGAVAGLGEHVPLGVAVLGAVVDAAGSILGAVAEGVGNLFDSAS